MALNKFNINEKMVPKSDYAWQSVIRCDQPLKKDVNKEHWQTVIIVTEKPNIIRRDVQ
jgi:hypothetical protein